ncbi:MAG: hypothetical protein V5A62_02175 [Haloarculaceae archaeon]
MFPRIDYVHWIHARIEAATHDLGSSDLRPEAGDPDRVVPARLADLPTPEEGLRTLVAAAAWDEGVLVVPGRFFGASEGVRVSLGGPLEEMEAAPAAFGGALDRVV